MPRESRLVLRVELAKDRRRWLADCVTIPGILVYGTSPIDAFRKAQALALDVLADRVRHGEHPLTGKKMARVGTGFRAVEFERAGQAAVAGQ